MNQTKVVVVEDERIVALNLKQQLQKLGYRVVAVAASGEQAVRAVIDHQADVVLMDIHIEGDMDGIAAAANIPAELNAAVIFQTAYSEEATLQRAKVAKPYGYLLKPYSERELHATIQMALERRELVAALRRQSETARAEAAANAEFLANMSHEIRTPLTGIIGFAGLLEAAEGLPDQARGYVDRILRSGEALLTVVNDILDLSKLEIDRMTLRPRAVAVAAFAADTLEMVASQAAAKGLALSLTIDDSAPVAIVADDARLRQVLLNLLGNAVKFTDEGRVSLDVIYSPEADGVMRFAVRDTGLGIPKAQQAALFQRFSQVDGPSPRRFAGSGLGLAISRRLVELMGGTIGLDSDEGRGSTFWFTVAAPAAEPPAAAGEIGAPSFGDVAGRILLVDDLAMNRELIAHMLAPLGVDIVEASGGVAALEAAKREAFDLILMDLQMPGMDGSAAAREIRAQAPLNASTPIFAVSADVVPERVAASLAAGMNEHIAKPIDPRLLISRVVAWLSRAPDAAVAEPAQV